MTLILNEIVEKAGFTIMIKMFELDWPVETGQSMWNSLYTSTKKCICIQCTLSGIPLLVLCWIPLCLQDYLNWRMA